MLQKPAVRRRWWEEDWDEDQWWAPKGSNSNSISSKKSYAKAKKGEGKTDTYSKSESLDVQLDPVDKQQKEVVKKDPVPAPKALPLTSQAEVLPSNKDVQKGVDDAKEVDYKEIDVPDYKKADDLGAETPREKLDPVLKGDTISPFEDPKPGPMTGPRDEAPSESKWEYQQLSGFGKYIDQGTGSKMEEEDKTEKSKEVEQDEREKVMIKVNKEIQAEEDNRVVKVTEENKQKVLDQFYGFGLESGPDTPAAATTPEKDEKDKKKAEADTKKEVPEEKNKENYNKGVIYDVIPGFPDKTHSVKKDLSNSEYMKDFVSTKANLQTSPNPPPPGIAEEVADSETTPLAPSKMSAKSEQAKFFIKSHPLSTYIIRWILLLSACLQFP